MMVKVLSPVPHVDRDEELRIFRRLLRGDHPGHMLLIQAGQGMARRPLMGGVLFSNPSSTRARLSTCVH